MTDDRPNHDEAEDPAASAAPPDETPDRSDPLTDGGREESYREDPEAIPAGAAGPGGDRPKIAQLHEMATEIVACRDEEELFELAVETAKGVLDFDTSSVLIHEEHEDGEWLVQRAVATIEPEYSATKVRPDEGLAGKTFRTGESYRVDDADQSADAKPSRERFRSAISVPIGDAGVFQAISVELDGFDERDVELAELLASHVAETLRRIRVENRLRERRRTVTQLHEGTLGLAGADSEDELFERAVDAAEGILDMDVCYLGIVEDGQFVPKGRSSWPILDDLEPLPLDYGVMGDTYETGDSFLIADAAADGRTHNEIGEFRSCISVPVGEFGVFQAIATVRDRYDETDVELAELLAAHVSESLARLRAETEVVEERDRLSALFDNVPDPAVRYEFVEEVPIVRDVNDAFEDVFGFDVAEIRDESVDDYIVPEEYADEGKELNAALMAGETVQHVTQRRTVDGVRDFKINVVPLEIGERSVEGFSIYTDITDQKRRERELRAQNERLDRFASVVSHDLRNPLSVASAYLEQARETGDLSLLEEVERGHERTFDIIDDVLALARNGGDVSDTAPVDLAAVAADAWANVDTDGATLDVATTTTVEADRSRLRQLLENLFRNCLEHGRPDGDDRDLTVTVDDAADGFAVTDDGVGFDDAVDLDRLFDFGYTAADDGTGLGLSIVAEIAEGHGWSIAAEESAAGGARFVFRVSGNEDAV